MDSNDMMVMAITVATRHAFHPLTLFGCSTLTLFIYDETTQFECKIKEAESAAVSPDL